MGQVGFLEGVTFESDLGEMGSRKEQGALAGGGTVEMETEPVGINPEMKILAIP